MNPYDRLYEYQRSAARHLANVLCNHGAGLDASDTGVGKTYVSLAACHAAGLRPLVVCPKAVVFQWHRAAEYLGVELLDALNYEKLRTGNTPWVDKLQRGSRGKVKFAWHMPTDGCVVFDEAHRIGGYGTQNSEMAAMAKAYRIPALLLSATLADSPLRMRAPGYLLGLHNYRDAYRWMRSHGCYENPWGGLEFTRDQARATRHLHELNAHLFPEKGVRLRVADLPEFPETQITAELYTVSKPNEQKINDAYAELEMLEADAGMADALTRQLRARQKVELCKLGVIKELIDDMLANNMSVVVFVSFRDSLGILSELLLEKHSVIVGNQKPAERNKAIDAFQRDETRVCLCTLGAGGTGLSLHDERGEFPRASVISPSFNAVELRQALGRVHRASSKSKSVQRLVYAAGTVEEQVAASVARKLANLDALNDGDLEADR